MFESIAALVNRRGLFIVVGWLALAALLFAIAPSWSSVSRDDDVRFFPAGYPTVIGQDLLEQGFPNDVSSSNVNIVVERRPGRLLARDFAYVDRIADAMDQLREADPELGIRNVTDHRTPIIGPRLIGTSADGNGQATLVKIDLNVTYISKQARLTVDRINKLLETLPPPKGLNREITGSAAVGHDLNTAANDSIAATTNTTIILVVVILLVVYRSPLLALIPLATIALSVMVSLKAIALLSQVPWLQFQVINVTHVFVVVVLFGAGTDYCLFLIARYREELARGRTSDEALAEAIKQVGGALVASAGTVIIGLGMLYFSTFAKIRYTGPAIALSLAIALAASLTLAPVLLHWLRGTVFWPFRPPHYERGADPEEESLHQSPAWGFWGTVSQWVVTYPGLILAVSLLALIPFAVIGAGTRSNFSQLADLHPGQASVQGARVVQRYFAVGELGPAAILIEDPSIDFRSEAGRQSIEELSRQLSALDNIAEVRSASRPLGKPLMMDNTPREGRKGPINIFGQLGLQAQRTIEETKIRTVRAAADPRYISTDVTGPARNHITRLDIVFRSDPFSQESMGTLYRIGDLLDRLKGADKPLSEEAEIGLAGSTAMVNDLERVTTLDEERMYVLVTLGVYLILVALLRRPGICLYLIVTVVLGYLASLGLTELIFQALHNGPEPWGGLDWKVGFFLFVILVAVGEDYNIFLMSRVIEEEHKHGPIEGTRLAVAHTGGIISSCGLIMAGTFGSMLTGTLTALQELGFALGLGVLLDTFVVRPVLVPAFVVLWHRTFPRRRLESHSTSLDEAAEAAPSSAT